VIVSEQLLKEEKIMGIEVTYGELTLEDSKHYLFLGSAGMHKLPLWVPEFIDLKWVREEILGSPFNGGVCITNRNIIVLAAKKCYKKNPKERELFSAIGALCVYCSLKNIKDIIIPVGVSDFEVPNLRQLVKHLTRTPESHNLNIVIQYTGQEADT
jgi:hypothetical protein